MNSLAESLRHGCRRHGAWLVLLVAIGLAVKALPVMAVAPSAHGAAIAGTEAHACAQAATVGGHAVSIAGSPAGGCCADAGHFCAAHCEPLMLTGLNLPIAGPQPGMFVSARITKPIHYDHPPLLRPPRA